MRTAHVDDGRGDANESGVTEICHPPASSAAVRYAPSMSEQRALVTGGAGFIGSHLVEALAARGLAVIVLDDLSTGRRENLRSVESDPRVTVHIGSAADASAVRNAMEGVSLVFHLASSVGVDHVLDRPATTMQNILASTSVVLAAAADARARVVLASSSEVYGASEAVPFREDDMLMIGAPTRIRWGYGVAKLAGEFAAMAARRERGLGVAVARLFNTIGPRQQGGYGMVVPRFVEAAVRNEPLRVHGSGTQTRSFCHVRDVVNALVAMSDPAQDGVIFNVGSTEEIAIGDLAARIIAIAGSTSRIERIGVGDLSDGRQDDVARRVPDLNRITTQLGWRATISLDDAIREIVSAARSPS